MAIRVQIPGPLRPMTGGAAEVEVEARDVGGLIDALEARHGGIRERLLDASGELRSYVRIFVDERARPGGEGGRPPAGSHRGHHSGHRRRRGGTLNGPIPKAL
jgi:molybdopterin converting factor small subunit